MNAMTMSMGSIAITIPVLVIEIATRTFAQKIFANLTLQDVTILPKGFIAMVHPAQITPSAIPHSVMQINTVLTSQALAIARPKDITVTIRLVRLTMIVSHITVQLMTPAKTIKQAVITRLMELIAMVTPATLAPTASQLTA